MFSKFWMAVIVLQGWKIIYCLVFSFAFLGGRAAHVKLVSISGKQITQEVITLPVLCVIHRNNMGAENFIFQEIKKVLKEETGGGKRKLTEYNFCHMRFSLISWF